MEAMFLRGRFFSTKELAKIKSIAEKHFQQGRTFISQEICRVLEWRQPNGWLKDRACRDALIKIEAEGFFALPPGRRVRQHAAKAACGNSKVELPECLPIDEMPEKIEFRLAKGNKDEILWNQIVAKHHYLGHRVTVGRCLKHLIIADTVIVGAISFSSPAWRIGARDAMLAQIGIDDISNQVINNSRFLILPWVKAKHLASRILSLATRRIVADWKQYYSIVPLAVETFVLPSKFNGTCYRAANWIEIGHTKGFAKRGQSYYNSQEPKRIFLYGLNRKIRVAMTKHSQKKT